MRRAGRDHGGGTGHTAHGLVAAHVQANTFPTQGKGQAHVNDKVDERQAGNGAVKEGQGVATIVIPTNASKWTEQAAAWLKEYVQITFVPYNWATNDTYEE